MFAAKTSWSGRCLASSNKSVKLFAFDFGRSESGRDITTDVSTRMWPSLAVALPTFIVGIWVNICVALMVVMFLGDIVKNGTMVLAYRGQ